MSILNSIILLHCKLHNCIMRAVYQNTFWRYHMVQIHVLHASMDTLLMDLDSTLKTVITKERRKIVTSSFASARDMNPITGDVPYYGVLTKVVELHYLGGNRVILFKCDWWDVINVGRGIKRDEYGYISVNFTRMLYTDEPFVLASQAKQVFYVKDSNESDWYTVVQTQPRDLYQTSREISNDSEPFQQIESYDDHLPISDLVDEDMIVWNRNDVLGDIILKNNVIPQNEKEEEERIDD